MDSVMHTIAGACAGLVTAGLILEPKVYIQALSFKFWGDSHHDKFMTSLLWVVTIYPIMYPWMR